MSRPLNRALRFVRRGAGLIALAFLLATIGALVAHDGRFAERLLVALITLPLLGALPQLAGRGAAKLARRVDLELELDLARLAILGVGLVLLPLAYLTLYAASDALPALLVFLGGIVWVLANMERSKGRNAARLAALTRAWDNRRAATALLARMVTTGITGYALLLVLWLA